jgi:hypothetical protein
MAYGAANIMQPDYTFALQFNKPDLRTRAADIKQLLNQSLTYDPAKPECVIYTPKKPQRLLQLVDDLVIIAVTNTTMRIGKADILGGVVASNLGYMRSLSAASTGPFWLCGKARQLLKDVLPPVGPPPGPPVGPPVDPPVGECRQALLISSACQQCTTVLSKHFITKYCDLLMSNTHAVLWTVKFRHFMNSQTNCQVFLWMREADAAAAAACRRH